MFLFLFSVAQGYVVEYFVQKLQVSAIEFVIIFIIKYMFGFFKIKTLPAELTMSKCHVCLAASLLSVDNNT